jgi:hypothetical protein
MVVRDLCGGFWASSSFPARNDGEKMVTTSRLSGITFGLLVMHPGSPGLSPHFGTFY